MKNPLRWRKMSWLILIFTGLMVAWLIAALATNANCDQYAVGSPGRSGCEAGDDIGTGIGVGLLFCVWFIGFVILSIIWFMTKPTRRICPVCGTDAKRGVVACKKCGYDFGSNLAPPTHTV